MKSQIKENHILTLFVPSGYDLRLKQVPEKEYFKRKDTGESPNGEIPLSEREKIEIEKKMDEKYAGIITSVADFFPKEMLLNLGHQYARMRNIKVEKIIVKDKHIVLSSGEPPRRITVRLLDLLTFLHANKNGDTPSVEGRIVGKIGAKNGNRSSGKLRRVPC